MAFAGFGIRSPAINSSSFRLSAGGSSQQEDGSPAVFKPLMLEMDGFRCAWQAADLARHFYSQLLAGLCVCVCRPAFVHPFLILFLRQATANTLFARGCGATASPSECLQTELHLSACRLPCAAQVCQAVP